MSNTLKKIMLMLLAFAVFIPQFGFAPKAEAAATDIPVILYHRIVANPTNQYTDTSIENFRNTMEYLYDNGYDTLSAEDYVDIKAGTKTAPDKPILLTFDDGTPDFVTNALPILDQYGMNAVAFIVTGWIDGGFSMTTAQLQDLADNHPNISIQSHTVNHADNTWNSLSEQDASDEIAAANDYLEAITGEAPVLLAYPYGHFNADVQAAAAANGIKYSFKVGYPNQGDQAMGRYYVQMGTTLNEIAGWIGGPAPTASNTKIVYHETFAGGLGKATQSGGASLSRVTGKVFAGNDDGAALYVSNRANNWDAADFDFDDIGLEDGKTYTVTATVYVDAGVTLLPDARAGFQTVDGYNNTVYAPFAAGQAVTLTGTITVDTSADRALRFNSSEEGKAVPFYIGDILITTEKETETTTTVTVYHEGFEVGKGAATQSGGASLSRVTGKVFAGNDDGAALYVSNRANNWDAADFDFEDIGLEDGKTYTVTATVYVDAGVTLLTDARAGFQTVDGYNNTVYAPFAAGQAVTLTGTITVDTSADRALRFNSSEEGKAVPFYIGDILITTEVSGEVIVPPQDTSDLTADFEDNTVQGWKMRNGVSNGTAIAVSTADAHAGTHSLLAGSRLNSNDGPLLDITTRMAKHYKYRFTAWAKMAPGEGTAPINMALQVSYNGGGKYPWIVNPTQVSDSEWVKLEGEFTFKESFDKVEVYFETGGNQDTKRFYIDDFKLEQLGVVVPTPVQDLPSIAEAYESDFLIGNAISTSDLTGDNLKLLKKHHNIVTAENAMKPEGTQPTKGNFTWSDSLVDGAIAQGLKVHGHVLVWNSQTPDWMNRVKVSEGVYTPLSSSEALANMEDHIEKVIQHYGNKVISWDVVNEAIEDNPSNPTAWKTHLDKSPWFDAIGPDYVEKAFLAARKVVDDNGWDIKLYYNDYNDDNANKAQAIASMVKELNDKYALTHPGKLLIDGIGMQAHYTINTKPDNVKNSLEKFISLGIEVSITELDMGAGSGNQLTEKQSKAQAYLYAQLMKIYKSHSDHIGRVTFWGLTDASSWRSDTSPLLFDKDLQAKRAYNGVIDPDTYIEENPPEIVEALQATAKFATPVIDGTVDSVWSNANDILINRYQQATNGATGKAKALWDDNNLYVLLQVNDDQLNKANTAEYNQDSVEIFVDQNNEKSFSYQNDDGQFRVNFDNETSFGSTTDSAGFVSATHITGTNYTVEVKIPLKKITPANDVKIGFDVQINDAKNGARQSVAAWNDTTGQGYQDPSVFGVLTLTGKGASNPGVYIPPATDDSKVDPSTGAVTIKTVTKFSNGVVSANVSSDTLTKALGQASANAAGKKQVTVEIPAQAGSTAYGVQLPVSGLKDSGSSVISIKTEKGTIDVPSNMFAGTDVGSSDNVTIRVSDVTKTTLSDTVRQQIGDRPIVNLEALVGDNVIAWSNPNAPVTVSVPYKPTAEELQNPDGILIWYIDGKGVATPVPSARYDAASGTVKFTTTHFSNYAVAYVVKSFGDLQSVPWAKKAIEAMASRGIISGTSASSFDPSASIKRADFLLLLVRALELKGTDASVTMFSDVDSKAYYYDAVKIAKQLGIIQGTGSNLFAPSSKISRQDMMVIAARAAKAAGNTLPTGGALDSFSDAASVASYAKDSAEALVQAGIVHGSGGKLAPNGTLTRAEAAVILQSIWSK